jgi:hypothetical protein
MANSTSNAAVMTRRALVRQAGLGLSTLAVLGAGALAYRAYDQGVLEAGHGPAYVPWRQYQDGVGTLPLVRAAILAPSPHNAQPWQFRLGSHHVDLYADRTRATGALDPFLRELHVGLGAALENIVLTARGRGYAPSVLLVPAGSGSTHVAHVALATDVRCPSPLTDQIPHRHTNRYPYQHGREIPAAALVAMSDLADPVVPDVQVVWLADRHTRGHMSELLVEATAEIIDDPEQAASDARWFRQTWDDIHVHRDGITIDTAGLPDLTTTLAKLLPTQSTRAMGEAWLDATRDRHARTAAAYGVIVVRDPRDAIQQLQGGRLLQRIHLWATGQAIALQPMNQVTERIDRERQLGLPSRFGDALEQLLPRDWQALTSFRVGHPTRQARRSPRRSVEAVILE